MKSFLSLFRKAIGIGLCLCLLFGLLSSASAYEATTLSNGSRGEDVRVLQQELIALGFLKDTADGIFGNKTETAVRAFQRKYGLSADGLAGIVTRNLLAQKAGNQTAVVPDSGRSAADSVRTPDTAQSAGSASSSFRGNYATLRLGSRGDRVRILQQLLISQNYLKGKADGIFGNMTLAAVKSFQKSNGLTVDGLAGKKTLSALESGRSESTSAAPSADSSASDPGSVSQASASSQSAVEINANISAPALSSVQLLHWFNDIKPSVSNGQHLLIYDPSSGLSWTLRILSRGRHCDAEPLTLADTNTMILAFGGINTWNQKPVYVKLPDGRWTIGSTHDMPHESGSIRDNGFDGHLCVHFLRDLAEARENDPNYGVSNQETIRSFWKGLTGQEIAD